MGIMAETIKTEKREVARDRRDWQKERSLASIADSLEEVSVSLKKISVSLQKIVASVEDEESWLVRAILEHATVMKQDVAKSLNNIAHRPRGGSKK